jgi:hypothetical protein
MITILRPSTTDKGKKFENEMIANVWAKATNNHDRIELEAFDSSGKLMLWDEYGNRNSEYGWEIDHILPREKGGKTSIENLQPLNWRTNEEKSVIFPWAPKSKLRVTAQRVEDK